MSVWKQYIENALVDMHAALSGPESEAASHLEDAENQITQALDALDNNAEATV